jgi:membrane protein involved in colicin uptake
VSVWGGESIHNAILSNLTSAPTGKKICKLEFTWNPDGTIATIKFFGENNELLFTLSFIWNPDGTLQSVART